MTNKPNHPYHIIEPSPWPLLSAGAALLLAVGTVLFMHDQGWLALFLGLLSIIGVATGWWIKVVREAVLERAHTPIVKIGLRYGMALFILSEIMFFVAFFWAFFNASLFPTEAIGNIWPPDHIQTVSPFRLPLFMTLLLLLSSTAVTWAHHAIQQGNNKEAARALGITIVLAVLFSIVQLSEYRMAHFGFTDTIYASTFYMATGFHGFHVILGTIFLTVCWFRTRKGHFTKDEHFGFEAAAWYWHFVDVVWLFLFVSIYWWGG